MWTFDLCAEFVLSGALLTADLIYFGYVKRHMGEELLSLGNDFSFIVGYAFGPGLWILLLLIFAFAFPVSAAQNTAPQVPESGESLMPNGTESFGEGLWHIARDAVSTIRPDLKEAIKLCSGIIGIVLLVSVVGKSYRTVGTCECVTAGMTLCKTAETTSVYKKY